MERSCIGIVFVVYICRPSPSRFVEGGVSDGSGGGASVWLHSGLIAYIYNAL